MFDQLSDRLKGVFDRLNSRGLLSESDVDAALREVRVALLEADVALPVIKRFMAKVRTQAVGEKLTKSVKPGEQVIKIVNDALVDILGEGEELNLNAQSPVIILMCGLQGSGKTTSTGKIAKYLKEKHGKRVFMASLDIYRPAAQQQLLTLAERVDVGALDIIEGEKPLEITKRAIKSAKEYNADVLFLDTAGRLEVDDTLMDELIAVRDLAKPTETLLVADSLTGQVAVKVASSFNEKIGVTGIVLTRIDGDGRGGAAFSMGEVTGKPIKFLGTGEGLGALELFSPDRIANRILGMGDVVALVEKMQKATEDEDMAALEEKMMSGNFDLADMRKQLNMVRKMGSMKGMMKMIPGMGKMMKQVDESKMNDKIIIHQIAVIDSMTPFERRNPMMLNARRRDRIARGAGVAVSAVNKVVKAHRQMAKMMKKINKMGGMGALMGNKNMLKDLMKG